MAKTASRAQYAKLRGVSRQAVDAAVKTGRIAAAVLEDGKLDVDLADKLWAENTNPVVGEHGHIRKRKQKDVESILNVVIDAGIDPNAPPPLAESKTLEAAYKARLAQIEYEEKSGKLVDAEKVKKEAFRTARITRDAMLSIPDRLAAELAGITEPFVIHQKLTAEIRGAIEEVSKACADE